MTRRRTVVGESDSASDAKLGKVQLSLDTSNTREGLVLRVHGLECIVSTPDGGVFRCAVRRLLKSMATDQRHVVVAGDRVSFRPEGDNQGPDRSN